MNLLPSGRGLVHSASMHLRLYGAVAIAFGLRPRPPRRRNSRRSSREPSPSPAEARSIPAACPRTGADAAGIGTARHASCSGWLTGGIRTSLLSQSVADGGCQAEKSNAEGHRDTRVTGGVLPDSRSHKSLAAPHRSRPARTLCPWSSTWLGGTPGRFARENYQTAGPGVEERGPARGSRVPGRERL